MTTHVPSETLEFHQFITEYLKSDAADMSPENLLKQWREQYERQKTIDDIQQGHRDYADGKAELVSEAFDDIRRQIA
ncbi:hypothetical protein Mal52_45520 [Symmachiella dynata]|uniref:Uncharacterized protein n=1 Tax=Symmachiella dynata TaxID=2527995 RepID=A0A517ZUD9_9PLAN|nr:hypothetical protein [Symmachiella dynata]QDU46055.1 hypothetical protein Mal52_45520 [Symmachiella dynata]